MLRLQYRRTNQFTSAFTQVTGAAKGALPLCPFDIMLPSGENGRELLPRVSVSNHTMR
jgi:hypothetical protein